MFVAMIFLFLAASYFVVRAKNPFNNCILNWAGIFSYVLLGNVVAESNIVFAALVKLLLHVF